MSDCLVCCLSSTAVSGGASVRCYTQSERQEEAKHIIVSSSLHANGVLLLLCLFVCPGVWAAMLALWWCCVLVLDRNAVLGMMSGAHRVWVCVWLQRVQQLGGRAFATSRFTPRSSYVQAFVGAISSSP